MKKGLIAIIGLSLILGIGLGSLQKAEAIEWQSSTPYYEGFEPLGDNPALWTITTYRYKLAEKCFFIATIKDTSYHQPLLQMLDEIVSLLEQEKWEEARQKIEALRTKDGWFRKESRQAHIDECDLAIYNIDHPEYSYWGKIEVICSSAPIPTEPAEPQQNIEIEYCYKKTEKRTKPDGSSDETTIEHHGKISTPNFLGALGSPQETKRREVSFKIPSEPPKETLFVRTLSLQEFYEKYWVPEVERLDEKNVDEWTKKRLEAKLPLTLRVLDASKKPIEKARIRLIFKSGEIVISSIQGELSLTVDKKLLSDLECRVDTPYFLSPQIMPQEISIEEEWTVKYDTGQVKLEIIDTKEYQKISNPPVIVYYSKDYEKYLAEALLDTLLKCEELIKKLTGESVEKWGSILIEKKLLGKIFPLIKGAGTILPIPYEKSLKDSSSLKWLPFTIYLLVHERTESPIAHIFYPHSSEARWIGDGIAEYVSYKVCKKFVPIACVGVIMGRIEQIRKSLKKIKNYNLLQEFTVDKGLAKGTEIGYPISFYIWYKVTEKAGDGVIKEFISKAKELENPTNEDYMNLLSKLTGLNIKEMVTNVDLTEVLKLFKELKCE